MPPNCPGGGLKGALLGPGAAASGGESERLDTEGTRAGRLCEENDGDGGRDLGSCDVWSARRVTLDFILSPAPRTDPSFSSFDVVTASLGGERALRAIPLDEET